MFFVVVFWGFFGFVVVVVVVFLGGANKLIPFLLDVEKPATCLVDCYHH